MEIEVANPDAEVKWLKNGQEIHPTGRYLFRSFTLIKRGKIIIMHGLKKVHLKGHDHK